MIAKKEKKFWFDHRRNPVPASPKKRCRRGKKDRRRKRPLLGQAPVDKSRSLQMLQAQALEAFEALQRKPDKMPP
jgi:hypothetical protein